MSEFQSLVSVYYSPRVILQMFSCTVKAYKTVCLIFHKNSQQKVVLIGVNIPHFGEPALSI